MASIRRTKTGSGAIAVQIVKYVDRKVVILKHIGSAHSPDEIEALVESAEQWLTQETFQSSLFPKPPRRTISLANSEYTGMIYSFAYSALSQIAIKTGLAELNNPILLDLAFMRLIEPTSKLRSIKLIQKYFSIKHAERSVYRALPKFKELKMEAERIAVNCAVSVFSSNLNFVLYDVTTLYFETFKADELRVPGFSKDNKSNQPQIVIGLLVTSNGFPLGYEVFRGNTFEGHTMIPILKKFTDTHKVALPTVVADAAMISRTNIEELKQNNLSYIVGARMANAKPTIINDVHKKLDRTDGATVRLSTIHGDLICSFSAKRFRKDQAEMNKQIEKSKILIGKHEPGKRSKFVKKSSKDNLYELDTKLIEKTSLLLGIKGYYTNIPKSTLSDEGVINHYRDLWHVEQAFRMAKNDLATRPIFHHKEDAVRAHMVVCFVSLILGKYIEIATQTSLRQVVDALWSVTDAQIVDNITGEKFSMRSKPTEFVQNFCKKLGLKSLSY